MLTSALNVILREIIDHLLYNSVFHVQPLVTIRLYVFILKLIFIFICFMLVCLLFNKPINEWRCTMFCCYNVNKEILILGGCYWSRTLTREQSLWVIHVDSQITESKLDFCTRAQPCRWCECFWELVETSGHQSLEDGMRREREKHQHQVIWTLLCIRVFFSSSSSLRLRAEQTGSHSAGSWAKPFEPDPSVNLIPQRRVNRSALQYFIITQAG